MSRAVVITEPGGPAVLAVEDRPDREPSPGEVRIRVRAAAVNPTDTNGRANGYDDVPRPWTPGMDAAGEIEALGEGVDRLAVGEAVMAAVAPRRADGGAQQELLVVPAESVVAVPEGASPEHAATLPMNGLTAQRGLDLLALPAGSTLLVTGGAGLLASYVIPLARERGLTVIADAKPEDEELVREFGADHVVPRGDALIDAVGLIAPNGVDGLYDTALIAAETLPAVRDNGVFTVVRGWEGGEPQRGIEARPTSVFEVLDRTDWLEELRAMASDGRIQLRVSATFAPEQAGEAHQLMDAGGIRGRAVIMFD